MTWDRGIFLSCCFIFRFGPLTPLFGIAIDGGQRGRPRGICAKGHKKVIRGAKQRNGEKTSASHTGLCKKTCTKRGKVEGTPPTYTCMCLRDVHETEENMEQKLENMVVPRHIALILDGNGRWAKKRGLPRSLGHKLGCVAVEKTVEIAARSGVEYLTVYGFSTENWKRSEEEVGALMQLFRYYMVRLLKVASANNVRVRMVGDRTRFAKDIIEGINRLESETENNTGLTFVIAVNYGSRDEITRAVRRLAADCAAGQVKAETITEQTVESYLDTAGMPDPDLLIRTSGELRLSNYLLWQLAYTEIYITDCLWPDFDQEELEKAILAYNKRNRRFGGAK